MAETNIHSRFIEAKYYDRGDPATVDFGLGDLTTDGTWRDLDLSSIVPDGTTAVAIFIHINDDDANRSICLEKMGILMGKTGPFLELKLQILLIPQT